MNSTSSTTLRPLFNEALNFAYYTSITLADFYALEDSPHDPVIIKLALKNLKSLERGLPFSIERPICWESQQSIEKLFSSTHKATRNSFEGPHLYLSLWFHIGEILGLLFAASFKRMAGNKASEEQILQQIRTKIDIVPGKDPYLRCFLRIEEYLENICFHITMSDLWYLRKTTTDFADDNFHLDNPAGTVQEAFMRIENLAKKEAATPVYET